MKYSICLRYEETSYAAWCPGLPGCWSEGATKEEAINEYPRSNSGIPESDGNAAY